jgi:sirohydrochlorin cobaltochelatase
MAEEDSWREHLVQLGFSVECPTIIYDRQEYFRGLAFYPKCLDFIIERLERSLELTIYY